jgi:hypothetical protein
VDEATSVCPGPAQRNSAAATDAEHAAGAQRQDRDRWHALVQNLRRGHYELAVEEPANKRLAVAFAELAVAL